MTLPRIIRPRQAPPDPSAGAPPPRWTVRFRGELSDLLVSHSFRPKLVESVVTVARLCLSLEAELAIEPIVQGDPTGDVEVKFHGDYGAVLVAAKGRQVVLSAWLGMVPAQAAFSVRDARGNIVGDAPACPAMRLRLGVTWATGVDGISEDEAYRVLTAGRKRIE